MKAEVINEQSELAPLRVRPGDGPVWIDASTAQAQFSAWRKAAAASSLSVDVLAGVLFEWFVVRSVAQVDPQDLLAAAAAEPARLAPTVELRRWDRQLGGRCRGATIDELPEICISRRVLAALGHSFDLGALMATQHLPDALVVERVAARHGWTMESWALRTALRSFR